MAHRPAEPGIGARLRRPGAFDEAAEHDAVDCRCSRASSGPKMRTRTPGAPGPAHHAVGDGGAEQFRDSPPARP